MKRLRQAPNLAIATLWADQLTAAGFESRVQRAYASSIAGEIPPDQSLPEVWVLDDDRLEAARKALDELTNQPWKHWTCSHCGEQIDGPFEQCWQCGAPRPAA